MYLVKSKSYLILDVHCISYISHVFGQEPLRCCFFLLGLLLVPWLLGYLFLLGKMTYYYW
jgi:hypothetical protein